MQGESTNIWKKNVLEDLEAGEVEFELVGELLAEIKKEFSGRNEKSLKVTKLKKIE